MKIAETLEQHGTTLREVARAIGMKPSTLQTTIDGNPTIGTLRKIAEAAKCPLAEFFLDEIKSDPALVERLADEIRAAGSAESEGRGTEREAQDSRPVVAEGTQETSGELSFTAGGQDSVTGGQSTATGGQPSLGYDLLTIDPVTGESRKYRLVR